MKPVVGAGDIPAKGDYRLDRARVPRTLIEGDDSTGGTDELAMVSITVGSDGRIAAIGPTGEVVGGVDIGGRVLLPTFVDAHTHLDKGHIWSRQPNPDGTFVGALEATGADRLANWTAEDVRARMEFGLKSAYAHGTSAIRTHLDSIAPQHRISWPVFGEVRAEWAGRIDLQAVPLFGIDRALDADLMAETEELSAPYGGPLGAVAYWIDELQDGLDALFRLASETGRDLDFHVDETLDPASQCLGAIAETALRFRFEGKILCGHCCSIAVQDDAIVAKTLDKVAEAGIGVVSLPMCNMYLQDRHAGRTPRQRGVTLLHEMKARGIPVMVASDNTRDPFYAYGDLDMWEVYRTATRAAHLDHPIDNWIEAATCAPADLMGLSDAGRFKAGAPADFIIFRGRSWSEILSRAESDRIVVRQGRSIDRMLPDYGELDAVVGPPAME